MTVDIQSHCEDRFSSVRDAFETNFTQHGDVGAAFALTVEGETVIDIWAGTRDVEQDLPWEEDTLVNVYSSTKTMTFLVALMLEDRGQLNLDAPVATYWPEFAQNGKEGVLVKHLLSHSSGLPTFSRTLTLEELYDWDLCCADLASQAPMWKPGTRTGYHAITQGFLIGEVIRRICGESFGTVFRKEVAERVDADFHIGVDPSHFDRIARLIPTQAPLTAPAMPEGGIDPLALEIVTKMTTNLAEDVSHPDVACSEGWRRAELPAANGHGNARPLVRAQTALANGGRAFDTELLSSRACNRAREEQIDSPDLVLQFPIRFGMGYAFPGAIPASSNPNAIFWGGAGGSTIVIDPDSHLCFSYVMNKMSADLIGDPRGVALSAAVYASLNAR